MTLKEHMPFHVSSAYQQQRLPYTNPKTDITCSLLIPHNPLSSVCLLALRSFPFLIPNHFSYLMRKKKAQCQGHREAPVNRKLVAPQHQGFTSSAERRTIMMNPRNHASWHWDIG